MKKTRSSLALLFIIIAALAATTGGSRYAHADGVTSGYSYNTTIQNVFWAAWNGNDVKARNQDSQTEGWVSALFNPNITIGYDIKAVDTNTGTQIAPGSTLTPGQKITLVFGPYTSDNIYWFGTGGALDSPYGDWVSGATPPARVNGSVTCNTQDFLTDYDPYGPGMSIRPYGVYIPFEVNPPARSLGNLDGLSCSALTTSATGEESADCTVTANSGTINPTFHFDGTYGKFYYRYYSVLNGNPNGACYGNNIPLNSTQGPINSSNNPTGYFNYGGIVSNNNTTIFPETPVNIPSQDFALNYTIAVPNNPPSTPTLSCPSSPVTTGSDVSVTLNATDPDNDQVKYGVGWNGSQTVDSGWTGLVDSGTSQTITKYGGYSTPGTYTVYGLASDSKGNNSSWASCQVTVTAPVADLTAGGVSPATGIAGSPVTFSSNVQNIGNGDSGAFPVLFQIQNGDNFDSGYISVAAGSQNTATASYTFNSAGTYQIRACANRDTSWHPITNDSNYDNDCGDWNTVTVYGMPTASLTVSPNSINSGESATITWSCGNGATSCTSSDFNTNGQLSGSTSVSPTQTTTYTLWANGPGGTVSASQTLNVGPKRYPDLTATPGNGASGYAGSDIGLSGTISNIGNASTGSSFYNMIQVCAANGDCNSFNQLLTTGLMGALDAGGSQGAGTTANFSNPGNYVYRLCADFNTQWSSSIDEGTGEGNNCSAWQGISVTAAPAADLTAGPVSPSSATAGIPVTFSDDAQNIGNADSGAFPVLFQIENGDIFDSGYISVPAGGATTATASYTFATPGTYQIRACVNRNMSWQAITAESNYDNDCGDWTTVTVNPGAQPDLTVGAAPDVTVTLGDPIPLVGSVSNGGDADAGTFNTIFVTNMNADRTAWTTIVSGSQISSLAQGASTQTGVTLPADTFSAPGSYAYAYCADFNTSWGGSIAESNEGNNCSAWGTITVQAKQIGYPDLVPGSAPDVTVTVGDTVNITGSVSNNGQVATGGSFPTIFMTNENSSGWDTLKSGSTGDALAPDASESVTGTLPSFSTPGTYSYQYCVDLNTSWTGSIDEGPSGEGNNCSRGTITVTSQDNNGNPNGGNPNNPNNPPPQSCSEATNINLTATPTRVESGSSSKLTVVAEGMNQVCTLTGSNGKVITLPTDMCNEDSQSVDTGPITTQTIFTLDCGTSGKKQAVVNVVPKFNEF